MTGTVAAPQTVPDPGASAQPLLRPRMRPRGFALTPLADVMFQLLLFFMLTSALAPYALLPLGTPAGASSADRGPGAVPLPDTPGPLVETQAIWHLGRDEIRSGQVRIALDQLPQALEGLQDDGIRDLVVLVTQTSQTADMARLLEAVQQADIARLQLIGG